MASNPQLSQLCYTGTLRGRATERPLVFVQLVAEQDEQEEAVDGDAHRAEGEEPPVGEEQTADGRSEETDQQAPRTTQPQHGSYNQPKDTNKMTANEI